MTAARRALGQAGEERAARWYRDRGWDVVDRNWRCREGEVDLICRRGSTLAFVEVKTRSSLAFGHPVEAVTPAKQKRIRILAGRWLAAQPDGGSRSGGQIRFDVAAVLPGRIDVVEGAF